jgi:hypothetical protein
MRRFIVIGGNPFRTYTGTTTYTSLKVVGESETEEGAGQIASEKYEECGGLLLVVDSEAEGAK